MAAKLREIGYCSNEQSERKTDMPGNPLYSPITGITCSDELQVGCKVVFLPAVGLSTRSLDPALEIQMLCANDEECCAKSSRITAIDVFSRQDPAKIPWGKYDS